MTPSTNLLAQTPSIIFLFYILFCYSLVWAVDPNNKKSFTSITSAPFNLPVPLSFLSFTHIYPFLLQLTFILLIFRANHHFSRLLVPLLQALTTENNVICRPLRFLFNAICHSVNHSKQKGAESPSWIQSHFRHEFFWLHLQPISPLSHNTDTFYVPLKHPSLSLQTSKILDFFFRHMLKLKSHYWTGVCDIWSPYFTHPLGDQ